MRPRSAGKWQINDFRVQPDILDRHGFDEWSVWTGGEGGNPVSNERYWDPYIYTSKASSRTYAGEFGPDIFNDFLTDFIERHRDRPDVPLLPDGSHPRSACVDALTNRSPRASSRSTRRWCATPTT